MQTISVSTLEYEIDVAALLLRRLRRTRGGAEIAFVPAEDRRTARVQLRSEAEARRLRSACRVRFRAAHFEIARIVNEIPLTLAEKQRLCGAAQSGAQGAKKAEVRCDHCERVQQMLSAHFEENDNLNLEGFLRFRMREELGAFELYALSAAEEIMLQTEYLELMRVLSVLVRLQQPRIREVSLILHADGSCTITDDTDARIECEDCGAAAGNELVNLLVALAPARIVVYDLSCGRCAELSQVLLQVFEDRVSFFR